VRIWNSGEGCQKFLANQNFEDALSQLSRLSSEAYLVDLRRDLGR
jgi:hypothetical protein